MLGNKVVEKVTSQVLYSPIDVGHVNFNPRQFQGLKLLWATMIIFIGFWHWNIVLAYYATFDLKECCILCKLLVKSLNKHQGEDPWP